MLSDLKKLKPNYLIVTDLARLSRKSEGIITIINQLEEAKDLLINTNNDAPKL
jgi:DNA invertase Pin-like site-specific DNA recombinase